MGLQSSEGGTGLDTQGGTFICLSSGNSGGAVDSLVPTDGLSMWLELLTAWLLGSQRECPKHRDSKTLG